MLDGGAWLDGFYGWAKHTYFFPEDVAYLKELCEDHEKDEGEVEGVAGQENEVVGEYSGQEQAVWERLGWNMDLAGKARWQNWGACQCH